MDIGQRVKEIVVEKLGLSEAEVVPSARFQEDLNADSLDLVEMIMALEEEFEVSIPDEDVVEVKSVQNAIDYISRSLKARGDEKGSSAGASS